jgi:peptidoglycan/LPS O-acetylase OafA/YrhL
MSNTIAYRPEIDGLRAVAVLPVVLFHMGYGWLTGGYLGVDVFFVISGFLITSIVIADLRRGTFRFRDFWARRIRRIVPALLVVTASTLAFTVAMVFKPDRSEIGAQAVAALLSIANVYFWRVSGDYWGQAAERSPFLHTWSLSVEEQFYLLLPLSLWLVFRYRPHRLAAPIVALVVASLAVFVYGSSDHPTFTFYMLPTRAWELATGCLVALAAPPTSLSRNTDDALSALATGGLCLILLSYVFLPNLGPGLAITVVGAALVLAFCRSGLSYAILSFSPVVHVGRVSYSLYLWHWPVLVFADYMHLSVAKVVLLAPTYLLAWLSSTFVEEPLRRSRHAVVPTLVALLVVLAAALGLASSSGEYDSSAFAVPQFHGSSYDIRPRGEISDEFARIVRHVDAPARHAPADAYKNGGILAGNGRSLPRVVVLGDSHGLMWSKAIQLVTDDLGLRSAFISMDGVDPFMSIHIRPQPASQFLSSEERFAYDSSRLILIEKWQPAVVIIASRWAFRRDPDDLLTFLDEHAGSVLLIEQPPELADVGNRSVLQYLSYRRIRPVDGVKRCLPEGNVDMAEKGRKSLVALAARHRRVHVVPARDLYECGDEVLVLDGRQVVYLDDDHLTTYGAGMLVDRLAKAIRVATEHGAETIEPALQ